MGGIESVAYMECPKCNKKTCTLINGKLCPKCHNQHKGDRYEKKVEVRSEVS